MRLLPLPGVFRPISDSWMLAHQLRQEQLTGARVLDLCTGSGMLAVMSALGGAAEVVAVDISRRALLSARLNAALNGVRVQTRHGDLFEPLGGAQFDVIVTNPPYVPSQSRQLPRRGRARAWEGGPRGRAFIDRICTDAPRHLRPGGVMLLVQSKICGEEQTLSSLRAGGLEAEVVFRHLGPFGPRMRERLAWLRRSGLLTEERDEVLIVRAQAPGRNAAGAATRANEPAATSLRASQGSPLAGGPPQAWRACACPDATG